MSLIEAELRGVLFQIAAQDVQLMRIGRLIQAAAALGWAVTHLHIEWNLPRILLFVAALPAAACLFYGMLILQAAMAFWTVESLEIMNVFTNGGVETAQYPLTIYNQWFRRFFTCVVPLASCNILLLRALIPAPSPLFHPSSGCLALPAGRSYFSIDFHEVMAIGSPTLLFHSR